MYKFLLNSFFFILLFFVCGCGKYDETNTIYNFYKEYTVACNTGTTDNILKKYCSKKMLADLDILYSFDTEDSIVVGIDYDIFFNAQDILPLENFKVVKIENNLYSVVWDGIAKPIKIKLVKEDGTFKIDELDSYNLEQVKKDVDDYWINKKLNSKKG